jgi:DNA polymerase III subunit gamma/tau
MEFQVSARKYRPASFDEVLGQPHVVQTLQNAIERRRIAHAYVFSGMRGVGKTTVARILAKSLNCERGPTRQPCGSCPSCVEITRGNSVDVIEIDGASNTGVDDVRELRENVKFSPFHGSYRVYIIDEVHMLSNSAFNALLKTLEEPPSHSVFIFATTEVHKIPATILSRCQHFTFRRISRLEIIQQLRHVADQTGVSITDRSLGALARASDGSMRDALSLLDQAVSFGGDTIKHEDLEILIGSVPDELVREMLDAILAHEASRAISLVGQLLDQGFDVRVYCREIVERCRNLLVARVVPSRMQIQNLLELGDEEVDQTIAQAHRLSEPYIQAIFGILSRTEDSLRGSTHPRFVLEAAVVKAALLDPEGSQQTGAVQPMIKAGAPQPAMKSEPMPTAPSSNRPQSANRAGASHSGPQEGRDGHSAAMKKTVPPPVKTTRPGTTEPTRPPGPPKAAAPNGNGANTSDGSSLSGMSSDQPPSVPLAIPLDWENVVERMVNDHPNVGSFLEKGSLVELTGEKVVLGYPKKESIARWRIEKAETRALIAQICQSLTGHPLQIQVIELKEGEDHPPSLAEIRAKKKLEDDHDLMENVKAHPLIKQARELFGGEVVSVQRIQKQT